MRFVGPLGAAVAIAALSACVSRPAPPAPALAPAPPLLPPAPPPPAAPPLDWQDAPLSRGDWTYYPGARAAFGSESPLFTVECTSLRQVALVRSGAAAAGSRLIVRTTFGERSVAATLGPGDPLLDELAFSRGRFLVRVAGAPDLILPAWPELARVVEDCRQ